MGTSPEVVVIGAGICGIATAYHLAVRRGVSTVTIVDPRPPMTLTSDKSTECYRNWWPTAPMIELMNRSIDLLDALAASSPDAFPMTRQGYLYVTADARRLAEMRRAAERSSRDGAGPLRVHPGDDPYTMSPEAGSEVPSGADLFIDGDALRRAFGFVSQRAVGGIHVRRAGWLDAQRYGTWMLERARDAGARLVRDEVVAIGGTRRVRNAELRGGISLPCDVIVAAPGPLLADVGRLVDLALAVRTETHLKMAFRDHLGVIPRDAPMCIWADPQQIAWSDDEARGLAAMGRDDLVGGLPGGCHFRPEGGPDSRWVLGLWEYGATPVEPTFPIAVDPLYPEVVLRGLSSMVPGLAAYLDRLPEPVVDGGYYTAAPDNMPLVGPAGPDGFVVAGAVSGYGIMASAAVGELVALHVMGDDLPAYAASFLPRRFDDPAYVASLADLGDTGQI